MDTSPVVEWRYIQVAQAGSCAKTLAEAAWSELPELRRQSCEAFVQGYCNSQDDAVELLAFVGEVPVAGGVILVEQDIHVGECVTLSWQYVLPEYRHLGLVRHIHKELRRIAKALGVPNIAYSHRVGLGKYLTIYRRI